LCGALRNPLVERSMIASSDPKSFRPSTPNRERGGPGRRDVQLLCFCHLRTRGATFAPNAGEHPHNEPPWPCTTSAVRIALRIRKHVPSVPAKSFGTKWNRVLRRRAFTSFGRTCAIYLRIPALNVPGRLDEAIVWRPRHPTRPNVNNGRVPEQRVGHRNGNVEGAVPSKTRAKQKQKKKTKKRKKDASSTRRGSGALIGPAFVTDLRPRASGPLCGPVGRTSERLVELVSWAAFGWTTKTRSCCPPRTTVPSRQRWNAVTSTANEVPAGLLSRAVPH